MGDRLAGKTAIVTGGARGTEQAAITATFVAESATVVVADILDEHGRRAHRWARRPCPVRALRRDP